MIRSFNRTKIIATVGPASNSYEILLALVKQGVDLFRLNFSHGTHDEHKQVIQHINRINKKRNLNVGILADLQGPKIRIGEVKKKTVLEKGQFVNITNKEINSTAKNIFINYKNLAD